MKNYFNAIKYYLTSLATLLTKTNFWIIPIILFKQPLVIHLKRGGRFFVHSLMDIWTIKEVVLDRQYEQVRKVKKDDVIIDIGAGIGDFSILTSKLAKKVFAFEIDLNRLTLIKKNMQLNNATKIKVISKKVVSLDRIFKEFKIHHCDFLKIDCEGSEYSIFRNASGASLNNIDYIAMEAHLFNSKMKKEYEYLKQKLLKSGFSLKEIENEVHEYLKFLFASKNLN